MIHLIHGDNHVKSRQILNQKRDQLKKKIPDVVTLDGKKLELTELIQATQSQSLLGSDRLVIIEDLFKLRSKKTLKRAIELINDLNPKQTHLILWESKPLTKSQLKKIKYAKVEEASSSTVIFKFLDNLVPGNTQQTLKLLKQSSAKDSDEFVFFMLAKHVGQLIMAHGDELSGPGWKIRKMQTQASQLGLKKLLKLHYALLTLDYERKTGQATGSLQQNLQILLITHLSM